MLGALHGPAELLPISSSGHVTVIPWLLGWDYDRLDSELRKAFEVALHAGTAAALLITLRDEVGDAVRGMDGRIAELIALSFIPPAIVGYLLERPIERHLGTPPTIAAGLVGGSLAMAWADRSPQIRTLDRRRRDRRAVARRRPGVRADPGRVAQRRDARRGAAAPVHARGRQPAVAPRRAAGDRGRDAAEGARLRAARAAAADAACVRRRRGRVVRVDARLDVADPPGRARPLAVARTPPTGSRSRERSRSGCAAAGVVRRMYDNAT